jgi:phospholipase/lecithinase/hemolysin
MLPLFLLTAAVPATLASPALRLRSQSPFTTLVTFGDSYTDDGRLGYYTSHNGSGPPAGVYQNVTNTTASGGLAWGQWAAQYVSEATGTQVSYVDYAISGATCSNELVSRNLASIHEPFPSVMDDEIPSFLADLSVRAPFLNLQEGCGPVVDDTVYALWIGTNDIGFFGYLSDSQRPGANLVNFTDCVFSVFDAIYKAGGRRFVVLNQAPLQLTPMYAEPELGGVGDSQYWTNKTAYNTTEYANKMWEYTSTVNSIIGYGVPFHAKVQNRWPGAEFSVFDVHGLMTDIYNNPKEYLDAPYNVSNSVVPKIEDSPN